MNGLKNEILNKIVKNDSIVIARHVRPDPDAVGSQLGLKTMILNQFPSKKVFAVGEDVDSLSFIGKMDSVDEVTLKESLHIILDTSNYDRIDHPNKELIGESIKIDHHPIVEQYGDLNYVDTECSSTCEVLMTLFHYWDFNHFDYSKTLAKYLYIGMVGDTGRFMYNNTTSQTLNFAGKLLKSGLDHQQLLNKMYEKPFGQLKLQSFFIENIKLYRNHIAYVQLTDEQMKLHHFDPKESSQYVNIMSGIEGVKIWVLFTELRDEGIIRVNIRSKDVVINTVAEAFNGGGHPQASGATIYHFEEVNHVLNQLNDALEEHS